MKFAFAALLLVASVGSAFGQFGRVIYISPDEKLRALVIPTKKADGYFHESRVEMQSASGQRIAVNDHSSPDREHGRGVVHAVWSPDSQFFVYTTTSSGGHSAWHFETFVFVRSLSRFYQLDQFVGGSIVDSEFSLFDRSGFHGRRMKSDGRHEDFEVQLSEIQWKQKT